MALPSTGGELQLMDYVPITGKVSISSPANWRFLMKPERVDG